jgi:hypothetical protein
VERARRYHRPLYAVRLAELVLAIAVPAALAFGRAHRLVDGVSWWWLEVVVLCAGVVLVGTLAQLPLSL